MFSTVHMFSKSTLSPGMLGAISALVATFFFSLNDSSIKFLSSGYALHQIVLIRSIVALVLLMVVIVPLDGGFKVLRTQRLGMHLIRGFCVVFANITFFLGLSVLPLADAVAVFFISPLIITALSVLILREQVGPRRWMAVFAGLIGVLIMVRPGTEDFRIALFLPMIAAFAYAFLHILTRKIGGTESAATMSVYIQITFIVVSGLVGLSLGHGQYVGQGDPMFDFLLRGWAWPAEPRDWGILFLLGITSALGGFFISQAYRLAEASVIAPLEYTAMPIAIFFGVVIFGEWPEPLSWLGMSLIIGAGLFIFWRESLQGRSKGVARPRTRR
ncbi:DMT family transporter [uncultured Shimia sp.]|uniref:DMT family transporter n=1 Tax=uncultured Shimia sp. TaxID=573152 RepID=UPI00341C395E